MTTAFIDVEGRRTRVRVAGDPGNPPVLLLHGIGRSLEDWAPQFSRLSEDFRLIALDLPGSGFSERCSRPTSLELLASGALAALDALGELRPVHVMGNSLGGAVAQQLLSLAPDRVASLVLVDSAGFGREVAVPLRLLTTPLIGKILASRTTPSSARMAERMSFADPALATRARVDHALAIAQQPSTGEVIWETARALTTLRGGVRPEWRASLVARVAAEARPTLIVWGDSDRVLPPHHLEEALRLLPAAESHVFARVGHMPQIEAPDEFASVAHEFLGRATGATKRARRKRESPVNA